MNYDEILYLIMYLEVQLSYFDLDGWDLRVRVWFPVMIFLSVWILQILDSGVSGFEDMEILRAIDISAIQDFCTYKFISLQCNHSAKSQLLHNFQKFLISDINLIILDYWTMLISWLSILICSIFLIKLVLLTSI